MDPDRDTPDKLKAYVRAFDPTFIAMTAPEPELQKLARMLGVAYAKVPGKTASDYTLDHSAALIVIDPQARIAGRSEEHTSELQSLMRNSYAVFCLKKKKITNKEQSLIQ